MYAFKKNSIGVNFRVLSKIKIVLHLIECVAMLRSLSDAYNNHNSYPMKM